MFHVELPGRACHRGVAITLLLLAACQSEAGPTAADGAILQRPAQGWSTCQDPNRGLAAAEACTTLIKGGQLSARALVSAHYNRALALGRRGRAQDAIADYDTVLQSDPSFALALYQRGLLYQQLGQQIRADQDLQRARQLDSRLR